MSKFFCNNKVLTITNDDGYSSTANVVANTFYGGIGTTYKPTNSIEHTLNASGVSTIQSGFTITQNGVTSDILDYTSGVITTLGVGSSGTGTIPVWANYASILCVGGGGRGGDGGGGNQNQNGYDAGAGGAGGVSTYRLYKIPPGTTTYSYSIGHGGGNGFGQPGGASNITIGALSVTANGGGVGGWGFQPGQADTNAGGGGGTGQWYANANDLGDNRVAMSSPAGAAGDDGRNCITTNGVGAANKSALYPSFNGAANYFGGARGTSGQGGAGGNNTNPGRSGTPGAGGAGVIFFFSGL